MESNILLSIIENIIYKDFIFFVSHSEFVYKTYIDQDEIYIVAGNQLKKELEENNLCFILELNLQAYKIDDDIVKIDNYDDFIKIYVKDNIVGKQIIENVKK